MCNAISLEITRREHCKPIYIPYIVVSTHDKPWLIPTSAHERALEAWRTSSRSYREDAGQQCSLQSWLLYTLGFISMAELTGSLTEFGGILSQFGLIAVTLNLATVENATLAIEYYKQVHISIRDSARARRKDIDYPSTLNEAHPLVKAMCKRDIPSLKDNFAATSSSSDKPPDKWSSWQKNKKGKGEPRWHANSNNKKGKGKGAIKPTWNSNKKWNNPWDQAGETTGRRRTRMPKKRRRQKRSSQSSNSVYPVNEISKMNLFPRTSPTRPFSSFPDLVS